MPPLQMTVTITDFKFHFLSAGQSMFSPYLQILLNPTEYYVTNTPKVLLNFQKGLIFLSKPFQISNKLTGLGFNIYIFFFRVTKGLIIHCKQFQKIFIFSFQQKLHISNTTTLMEGVNEKTQIHITNYPSWS